MHKVIVPLLLVALVVACSYDPSLTREEGKGRSEDFIRSSSGGQVSGTGYDLGWCIGRKMQGLPCEEE